MDYNFSAYSLSSDATPPIVNTRLNDLQSPTLTYNPPASTYSLLPTSTEIPNLQLTFFNLPVPAHSDSLYDTPGAGPSIVNTILPDLHSSLIGKIEKETNVGPATPLRTDSYDNNRDYDTLPLIVCKVPYLGAIEQTLESPHSLLAKGYDFVGMQELQKPSRSLVEYYIKEPEDITIQPSVAEDTIRQQFESSPTAKQVEQSRIPSKVHAVENSYIDGVKIRNFGVVFYPEGDDYSKGDPCGNSYSSVRYASIPPENIIDYKRNTETGSTYIITKGGLGIELGFDGVVKSIKMLPFSQENK